jgi:hypothetical protein
VRRVERLSESQAHVDAVSGDALDPLASVCVTDGRPGGDGPRYFYNALSLVQFTQGAWIVEPFCGLRVRRADERWLLRLALTDQRRRNRR